MKLQVAVMDDFTVIKNMYTDIIAKTSDREKYAENTGKKKYLLYAILLHAIFDIFPALQQRGVVPMFVSELWLVIWLAVTATFAWKLYKNLLSHENA